MDRFQIDALISADLTEIVVDQRVYEQKPPNRFRFSLAHEFAHLILHAEVYRSLVFKTPEQWKAVMLGLAANDYNWLEWQANTFAGLLLVPPAHLRQQSNDIQAKMRSGQLDPSRLDEQGIDRVIRMLAQRLAVSRAVIERRLQKDEIWPYDQRGIR
jgi:Zn-dependent peptidase ImmA (M78 family)